MLLQNIVYLDVGQKFVKTPRSFSSITVVSSVNWLPSAMIYFVWYLCPTCITWHLPGLFSCTSSISSGECLVAIEVLVLVNTRWLHRVTLLITSHYYRLVVIVLVNA